MTRTAPKPDKYDTEDGLRRRIDHSEVYIDDVDDETWMAVRYRPEDDTFSILVDGRQLEHPTIDMSHHACCVIVSRNILEIALAKCQQLPEHGEKVHAKDV